MKELVESSDEIVHGHVEKVESVWRGGRIETDTTIAVMEGFKGGKYSLGPGKRAANRESAPRLQITTLGGSLKQPPIAQHSSFTPYFAEQEEVILFLQYPTSDAQQRDKLMAAHPGTRLAVSPRITGVFQGKFTVFQDKLSGARYVSRFTLDGLKLAPTRETMSIMVEGLRNGRLAVTQGTLVANRVEDAPDLASIAAVTRTVAEDQSRKRNRLSQPASSTLPIQDFSQFVNQIKDSLK
jgi:hypothetical protein